MPPPRLGSFGDGTGEASVAARPAALATALDLLPLATIVRHRFIVQERQQLGTEAPHQPAVYDTGALVPPIGIGDGVTAGDFHPFRTSDLGEPALVVGPAHAIFARDDDESRAVGGGDAQGAQVVDPGRSRRS